MSRTDEARAGDDTRPDTAPAAHDRHQRRVRARAVTRIGVILVVGGLTGALILGGPDGDRAVDTFEVDATALPDAGLGSREGAAGVWTGGRYLVWGGWRGGTPVADGAAYDPAAGTWTPIPDAPIPGRQGHVAVWTGTEMLVWGGSALPPGRGQGALADGAAYDPAGTSLVLLGTALRRRP